MKQTGGAVRLWDDYTTDISSSSRFGVANLGPDGDDLGGLRCIHVSVHQVRECFS